MKKNEKGFYLFFDWIDDLENLGSDDAWKIVKAICEYHRHGTNPVDALDGPLRVVCSLMFHQIKRGEQISEARRAAVNTRYDKPDNFVVQKPTSVVQPPTTYNDITELRNTDNQSLFLSGASARAREREAADVAEPLPNGTHSAEPLPDAESEDGHGEDPEDEDPDDEWLPPGARDQLTALLREQLKQKYLGGTLGQGVVMMNELQFSALCEDLSLEELDKYMRAVADCEKRGKHYRRKTHYQAILDMAAEDRRTQERTTNYGR